jgi:hypothetical protein
VAPGRYALDIELSSFFGISGDVPIVVFVTGGPYTYSTRVEDQAPVIGIL